MPAIREMTVEEFLGRPLNHYEKRYAPNQLYVCGRLSVPFRNPLVSVVGTRKASKEGLLFVEKIVKKLCEKKVIVVSGLARGIDTAAHRETIKLGGETVAVLGTPLNRFYPPENRELQQRIMMDHMAVSQFPENHITQRHDFILRNRTMALISDATVIVEAGEDSGALSQGWETIRLGRPLFISPLVIDQGMKWPQKMIEYGARIFNDFEELLEMLPNYNVKLEEIIRT